MFFPGQGVGLGFSFSCRSFAASTRGGVDGVGGFILSIKILLFELGRPSSREIAKFGDPPRNFVEVCSVMCVLKPCVCGLKLSVRITRQKSVFQ